MKITYTWYSNCFVLCVPSHIGRCLSLCLNVWEYWWYVRNYPLLPKINHRRRSSESTRQKGMTLITLFKQDVNKKIWRFIKKVQRVSDSATAFDPVMLASEGIHSTRSSFIFTATQNFKIWLLACCSNCRWRWNSNFATEPGSIWAVSSKKFLHVREVNWRKNPVLYWRKDSIYHQAHAHTIGTEACSIEAI